MQIYTGNKQWIFIKKAGGGVYMYLEEDLYSRVKVRPLNSMEEEQDREQYAYSFNAYKLQNRLWRNAFYIRKPWKFL